MKPNLAAITPRTRALVGVSGGRDSVVLLHWLVSKGFRNLVVCHLDHGLRGRASRADAEFVAQMAGSHGLPFVGRRVRIKTLAERKQQSIETAARDARYRFFADIARRKKCRTLLLAHHADDQVETFLFNLFRGSGATGLGAMRPVSLRNGLRIVRPLLGVWRSEIDVYARKHRLRFREDASNKLLAHQRNRMRHRIIPALEKFFGRDIRQSVWRAAEILAAEDDCLGSLVPKPARELSLPALRAMPVAMQRRLIRDWFRRRQIADFGFEEIEAARALIVPGAVVAKINLPGARHLRRRAKRLFIE
jgi:tRNA(Ile)-lysidine synthase